jgi:hypothetical protein
METVNFQCGNCHNLMAVGSEYLGRQVRCPHCQQVVLAPAPTAPPPPLAPGLLPPLSDSPFEAAAENAPANEHESIFGEVPSDDLFGGEQTPVVEMPPEPAAPPLPHLALESPAIPAPAPATDAPTEPFGQPAEHPLPAPELGAAAFLQEPVGPAPTAGDAAPAPAGAAWLESPAAEAPTDLAATAMETVPPRSLVKQPQGLGLSGWLLIILIPYSILMTIIAVVVYLNFYLNLNLKTQPHPLEYLPDIDGQYSPPSSKKVQSYERPAPEGKGSELPQQLRLALGQTKAFGDLEVTPRDVTLRKIEIIQGHADPSVEVALVLKLHLKNISTDWTFHPTDPWFVQTWKPGAPGVYPLTRKPYTYLEMGTRRFYGGPIKWEEAVPGKGDPRQYIKEQHLDTELKPGEAMDTIVCTDPADGVEKALKGYKGPLLWRIQLRRGHENYKGHLKSVTCVVGVEFSDTDVRGALDPS